VLAGEARTLRARSAAEITKGILDHVRRFTGRDQHHDDLTLVTARRV
jgi:serine phosphatase RsbU (regulator of sigma subunit)